MKEIRNDIVSLKKDYNDIISRFNEYKADYQHYIRETNIFYKVPVFIINTLLLVLLYNIFGNNFLGFESSKLDFSLYILLEANIINICLLNYRYREIKIKKYNIDKSQNELIEFDKRLKNITTKYKDDCLENTTCIALKEYYEDEKKKYFESLNNTDILIKQKIKK